MLDVTAAPASPQPPPAEAEKRPRSPRRRAADALRANRALAVLVSAGLVLRLTAMLAYWPAFGIWDDTKNYMTGAQTWVPDQMRPFGYSIFLWPFSLAGQTWAVSLAQHLLGIGVAVALYAFLRSRGIRAGWAAAAVALPLIDARQIAVEHYVLSDTLFIAIVAGALLMLLRWREQPPAWAVAACGLLFAYGAITRSIGLVILPLPILFLLLRRVRLVKIGLMVLAMAVPISGYLVWYHHHHGVYAMNQVQGRFLWSRTTSFVDCSRTDFTPQERALCPGVAVGQRPPPDAYVWGYDPEALARQHPDITDDEVFGDFARKAILGQPAGFATTVAEDLIHMSQIGWVPTGRTQCVEARWALPHRNIDSCPADLMAGGYTVAFTGPAGQPGTVFSAVMSNYGRLYAVPPAVYIHIGLLGLVLALVRLRRDPRPALESLLIGATGAVLLAGAVATSAIDSRYGLPMLFLAPVAAVLAAKHRWTGEPG